MTARDDYLFLEPLLVERVRETVPDLEAVLTADSFAKLKDKTEFAQAAHVIYVGDEERSGEANQGTMGGAQNVIQLWAVVIAVHYAAPDDSGEGARRMAGPLISQLLRGLSRWTPHVTVAHLKRGRTLQPSYINGHGYFPFVFRAQFVFNA